MNSSLQKNILAFLREYPLMRIVPNRKNLIIISGKFHFSACVPDGEIIEDSYEIILEIPHTFPRGIPVVKEVENRIPDDGKHHVNSGGNSLCLGSPFRILVKLKSNPSLIGFAKECLVPYFYATSYKLKYKTEYLFGELRHGKLGIYDDLMEMFEFIDTKQVDALLKILVLKKRVANKCPCPCGCGLRFGRCTLRLKITELQKFHTRSIFRKIIETI